MFLCKWRARKQISLHRDNKVVLCCYYYYYTVLFFAVLGLWMNLCVKRSSMIVWGWVSGYSPIGIVFFSSLGKPPTPPHPCFPPTPSAFLWWWFICVALPSHYIKSFLKIFYFYFYSTVKQEKLSQVTSEFAPPPKQQQNNYNKQKCTRLKMYRFQYIFTIFLYFFSCE